MASVQVVGNVSSLTTDSKEVITTTDLNGNRFEVPNYSMGDILSAIPKHCYDRNLLYSLHFVARDIAAMVALGYLAYNFIPMVPNYYARGVLWSLYSYATGLFSFGLWILAHECGHSAFSDYPVVNNFVGWVLHSYCGVPYFSWKYSHAKHHKATGHLTRDMVFVPYTAEEFKESKGISKWAEAVEDTPIYTMGMLLFQQIGGMQLYLSTNASGQPINLPWWKKSHFHPTSPIFEAKDYWYVILSDIGLLLVVAMAYWWYKTYGLFCMVTSYFIPYLYVNHWLVFITFLQHTDASMPHYTAEQWTFARGAAATIDRNFGFVGQHIFHDIAETHVLHHYVSRIPFYRAREATAAIQKVMGQHYRYEGENMWKSLWKCARTCQFVEDTPDNKGVLMFRNVNGVGVKPRD
ncbi:hypothetical protein BABINDRAFT_181868 [Babjeviella inositovora NRRL Y-12698]|uniref:Fatty acid desaturase domain-containing protein n=1 Tax=Babjeviella inositovora NRRL Y-12698 TaxID=984486 RepID=A0A1E3QHU0_9ASCO|nr:uncharacterized protein BABINDRAFT_181868 [Babjeviella inositovora NRRL Y-12698]ODQ77261.1 hypothetical protein BABINDRAFT_181868 [Babjeviella inositovora NRRL Y-12698]